MFPVIVRWPCSSAQISKNSQVQIRHLCDKNSLPMSTEAHCYMRKDQRRPGNNTCHSAYGKTWKVVACPIQKLCSTVQRQKQCRSCCEAPLLGLLPGQLWYSSPSTHRSSRAVPFHLSRPSVYEKHFLLCQWRPVFYNPPGRGREITSLQGSRYKSKRFSQLHFLNPLSAGPGSSGTWEEASGSTSW